MFELLEALRDRVADDLPIRGWLAAQFPSVGPHFYVGIRPDYEAGTSVPSDCFPYVAVSHLSGDKPAGANPETETISILFGVNNDHMDVVFNRHAFTGLQQIFAFRELIITALNIQPLLAKPKCVWEGGVQTRSDSGMLHPFYEMEIVINVQVRT